MIFTVHSNIDDGKVKSIYFLFCNGETEWFLLFFLYSGFTLATAFHITMEMKIKQIIDPVLISSTQECPEP